MYYYSTFNSNCMSYVTDCRAHARAYLINALIFTGDCRFALMSHKVKLNNYHRLKVLKDTMMCVLLHICLAGGDVQVPLIWLLKFILTTSSTMARWWHANIFNPESLQQLVLFIPMIDQRVAGHCVNKSSMHPDSIARYCCT